jgi:nucleoside-diphosphate-sugar epimerase
MVQSLSHRRIAVLGGTGFIGSHLVERLVLEGAEVLAVGRSVDRVARLSTVSGECAIALCDLRDADGLARTFRQFRPGIVYHLAGHPDAPESFDQFASCLHVNGLGLVNALRAAAASGAELFVYGDSTKVYGNRQVPYRAAQDVSPICSYAVVKAAGWHLCQLAAALSSMAVVALRLTFIYGPRQNRNVVTLVRECVAAGRPIRLQGGAQTRDPLYIDDAVAAFAAVGRQPASWGHAIPIGGGQEITVASLCEAVLAALGAHVPVVADADAPRLTEIWRSSSDNVDARRLLDWQPRVSLSEGLARTVASWVDDRCTSATWFGPLSRPALASDSHFVYETAPNVRFAVLDRRSGGDRRAACRGGRRSADIAAVVDPVFALVVGSRAGESPA